MSRNKLKHADRPDEISPTPERRTQSIVERAARVIADEEGRVSRPYRALDSLTVMLRKGSITPAMHQAGDDFHTLFMTAQLQTLRAADLSRLPDGMREVSLTMAQAEARKNVWRVLQTVGGMASPAGSCLWHVVGCEWTLKDWALRESWNGRNPSQETASGILIGALSAVQAYFGL